MCEELKGMFGEDYHTVVSKFYMQQANLAFIMGDDELAKTAAERGIELVVQVESTEEPIMKAS